jgi:hypothetical protein
VVAEFKPNEWRQYVKIMDIPVKRKGISERQNE